MNIYLLISEGIAILVEKKGVEALIHQALTAAPIDRSSRGPQTSETPMRPPQEQTGQTISLKRKGRSPTGERLGNGAATY
jgi:hypothetical protein